MQKTAYVRPMTYLYTRNGFCYLAHMKRISTSDTLLMSYIKKFNCSPCID